MLILLAICGFGIAGVLGAITAHDWTEDFVDRFNLDESVSDSDIRDVSSDLVNIRNSLAATSVSSQYPLLYL